MVHISEYFTVCLLITISLNAKFCASFSGWIDPDTLPEHQTLVSYTDGLTYDVVMSDEFNREGRSFKDGDDPMWTG
jgi:hypothetical protein